MAMPDFDNDEWFLTPEELEQIRKRCEKATPGPWKPYLEGRDHTSGSNFIMTGEGDTRGMDIELIGATEEDYDFIAYARQDVPNLLKEVEYLRNLVYQLSIVGWTKNSEVQQKLLINPQNSTAKPHEGDIRNLYSQVVWKGVCERGSRGDS